MKVIKNTFDVMLNRGCECWDLGNEFIANVYSYDDDKNEMWICLHDNNKKYANVLSPAERCIRDENFAREIQKKIDIKIDYGIDAVCMVCSKDQLIRVLTEISKNINNQH